MARVWTYGRVDYDPERDGDEEAWAATLAAQGFEAWALGVLGPGP